ncbi:mechanosensitive ion channel domain-containing protein [Aliihoeflea sp. 40Bstr573]|uniref:mechanosensitive ion channel domain-containing protein n=1 Tax=Aliihoeflea sp. 40Bstr573 TaxID=2696467 RepID=UPI00209552D8|nr:mechanosensitive ion channel domain-containing protein [Aliihoeflea sp. 40Bstr573]MCO6388453.1 mechanosensitive ion channel [Aliihoeflea sp. 40Bstr573]
MRFIVCAFLALFLSVGGASAQLLAQGQSAASEETPAASVDDLIRLLENDTTRNELIERLRAAGGTEGAPEAEAQAAEGTADPTIARQIAEYTRDIAEGVSTTIGAVVELGSDVGAIFSSPTRDFGAITQTATSVAILAVALFASYFFLRALATQGQKSISNRVAGRGWVPRIMGIVGAAVIDVVAVAAAWAIGYAISLYFFTGPGRMGINQTLLLNAFLAVEMTKVVARAIFEPHGPALRPLPMNDTTAAYWYFWAARIIGLLGYSFMFFAPILADMVSPTAAQALRVLAMLTAVVIGILIVLQNKAAVRNAMTWRANNGRHDALSKSLAFLGAYWHMIAIAYLVAILVVWLANPAEALPYMLGATIQSIAAVVVGVIVISFISRFIHVGVRLPDDLKQRLPLLEARLHAFVPRVMEVVRTVTLIGVAIAIAQAWGLIDFLGWVASEGGQRVTGSVISALIILLVGFLIYLAMSSWVEYRLNPNFGTVPTAREKTLLSLFRNAFTIALAVFIVMLALAQIGINIAPLLAGAGVLGLAIGFGAQKFVQDIITGIFIQLENIMNEGDVVSVGATSGVVERLTIRSVSIRSLDGTLHLIPFSSVDMVSNSMKGFSYHVAEIGVAYDSDISEVKTAMQEAFDNLMETDAKTAILEPLEIHGVTLFGDSAINVRARIKTLPGSQWGIGRQFNEFIKAAFERRGIEIPFPQVTYHVGVDGQADALLTSKTRKRRKNKAGKIIDQPSIEKPEEADTPDAASRS